MPHADTWDPELHGADGEGGAPQPAPESAALDRVRPLPPSPQPQPYAQQTFPQQAPQSASSHAHQQPSMGQPVHRTHLRPQQPGIPGQEAWPRLPQGAQMGRPGQPHTGQPQMSQPPQLGVQHRDPRVPPSYEHYRDAGVLPWWAWASIGAVVISCGLLVAAAFGPHTLDPDRSAGFEPGLHEDYADMPVLEAGATFEGSVDSVPWELTVADINWDADEQASVQTSLPAASSGMRYIGVELDLVSDLRNTTPVDEAFLFYYLTPGGQEYSEHYCGYGCLSDVGSYDYTYDGWIYFEVPDSVPEGGHLRVNLLYSGTADTLMELP